MPQLSQNSNVTPNSAPLHLPIFPSPPSAPHPSPTSRKKAIPRGRHRPVTLPKNTSSSSSGSSSPSSPSPTPSPAPPRRAPPFQLTQPLGRPIDLVTFLENINQLKKLIVKAKNTLGKDKIKVLERELVGGEHGWRVGLAVAYLDGFLKGGSGVG